MSMYHVRPTLPRLHVGLREIFYALWLIQPKFRECWRTGFERKGWNRLLQTLGSCTSVRSRFFAKRRLFELRASFGFPKCLRGVCRLALSTAVMASMYLPNYALLEVQFERS